MKLINQSHFYISSFQNSRPHNPWTQKSYPNALSADRTNGRLLFVQLQFKGLDTNCAVEKIRQRFNNVDASYNKGVITDKTQIQNRYIFK